MATKSFLSIMIMDYQDNGAEDAIAAIPLDVCKSRTPKYQAEVTHFPVEAGYSITDNRRKEPDEIEIEGIVSETPIDTLPSTPVELRGDGMIAISPGAPAPTQSAHDALVSLHEDGTLVTIVDQYRSYKDMVLTSLIFPRTKDTGNAIEFQATFTKLRIVSTSAVALPEDVLKKLKKRPKVSANARLAQLRNQLWRQQAAGKISPEQVNQQLEAAAKKLGAKIPKAA